MQGVTVPTARITSSVNNCFEAFEKESFFKSSYGSFAIIEEFLKQAIERKIPLECIDIIYRLGSQEKEIKIQSNG